MRVGKRRQYKKGMEWAIDPNRFIGPVVNKNPLEDLSKKSNMTRYVIQKQIFVLQQCYGLSFGFAAWKLNWR